MRTTSLFLLFLFVAPAFGGDTDELVDRLFSKDAEVRAAARAELLARGDGALPAVLARLEARAAAGVSVLHVYDLQDLAEDDAWFAFAVRRVRALVAVDGDAIRRGPGMLVVRAPRAVQARVAAELRALRATFGRLVELEVRFVRGPLPARPAALDAAQWKAHLARADVEVLSAPKLTCRNGVRAEVSVLHEVSFVADVAVEAGEGGFLAEPTLDVAREGFVAKLRPVWKDGKIAVEATVHELEDTLPELPQPVPGAAEGVTVQIPAGRARSVVAVVTCAPGEVVPVIVGDRDALLVTARPVEAGPR